MAEHILKAYEADVKIRTEVKSKTGDTEHSYIDGYKVNVHEILPGVIYKDQNVTVTAFAVHHGKWAHAYGYRFETPDRTIVISGDTSPDAAIVDNCHGCDVLIHEVYTQASFDMVSPEGKQYRLAYHTSSKELAEIATKAKAGLLILYHRANPGCHTQECREAGSEEQLLKEVRQAYGGKLVAGHDLEFTDAKRRTDIARNMTGGYREFRPYLNQHRCGTLIADLVDAHWFPCWQAHRSLKTGSLCLVQSSSAFKCRQFVSRKNPVLIRKSLVA